MKINILLPYKEQFDPNKASSVSITVRNNLYYSRFLSDIKIYGQNVETPFFSNHFIGFKYSLVSLKSKNNFLAHKMLSMISQSSEKQQLIEIHNRPYLINQIAKANNFPISLFFHNDPQKMKGSKSVKERENILEKCAAVFCVSKYIKNKFIQGISLNIKKVHVLYNGIKRKTKKFPNKKKEILFVGRLVPEKGFDLYVEVIQSIASDYPNWSFGLIGSFRLGANENNLYANKILDKFKTIGYQAKYYGFKNHEFVEKKMKTASIVIIPSLWQEPFGLVVAEAMSNGAAVITSKVGGIPEIVKKNGVLIDNINKIKLQKNLLKLLDNKKLRKNYQLMAWENFDLFSINSSRRLDKFREIIFKNYY